MHFELLFVYGVRLELDLFFSTRLSIISAPLIEKTFLFPKALFWCLYQKSNDCINVGLFMGSLLFYWSICLCLCQYHIITITVSQKWGSVSPPVFVKTVLDVLGPLYFHFRTCLPLAGIMIGIYISVWEEFLSLQYLVFQCMNMHIFLFWSFSQQCFAVFRVEVLHLFYWIYSKVFHVSSIW